MRKSLIPLLTAVLALGLFAAGCGGDDDETTTTGSSQTQTSTGTTSTPSGTSSPANVEQAVDACKQGVDNQPNLSDDLKNDLKEICDKAASGKEEDIKSATREVCTKIVEEQVPEGAARDQAIETCKTATE